MSDSRSFEDCGGQEQVFDASPAEFFGEASPRLHHTILQVEPRFAADGLSEVAGKIEANLRRAEAQAGVDPE